jgi:putative membrane protein
MQSGRRYTLFQTLKWSIRPILFFLFYDSLIVVLYFLTGWEWILIPWQPISLIGIAVAFYLGFKNNSSYERLWEARKIWGGIVNASRSFAVMARDFVNNDEAAHQLSESQLHEMRKGLVHRHVAWLHALSMELRKMKDWEHQEKQAMDFRAYFDTAYKESWMEKLKEYISEEEYQYVMSKGNRSSHLMSQQSKALMHLRKSGHLEHFRHLQMQELITEFYGLQGKAERIKNFPFPRQYATVNYFLVSLFILMLPFGMLDVFTNRLQDYWIWITIPFSIVASWVFWMMEMIGDYSENPFEGTYNDVPIRSMAEGIEIDIRQMLDETDLPKPAQPEGDMKILV